MLHKNARIPVILQCVSVSLHTLHTAQTSITGLDYATHMIQYMVTYVRVQAGAQANGSLFVAHNEHSNLTMILHA